MARNLGVLAGLASTRRSAAIFLNSWLHEAMGEELGHYLNSGENEGI